MELTNVKIEENGISFYDEKGKRIFISQTIIRLLGEVKEVDTNFTNVIDALVDIKHRQYKRKHDYDNEKEES